MKIVVDEVEEPSVADIMGILDDLGARMERAEVAIADTASLFMAYCSGRDVPQEHITRAVGSLTEFVVDLGQEMKEREEVRKHIEFLDSRE